MDAKELRLKSSEELQTLVSDLRSEIQNTRFGVASRQIKKVSDLRRLKKDLARALTIVKESKK